MSVHRFEAKTIDGSTVKLADFAGKALLIVNVASRCGFTPQYAGLEALYRKHKDRGFVVLGFPCDQFGQQEPGTESEIKDFCTSTYDVTFPLFGKVEVNGANAHPLFRHLRAAQAGVVPSKPPAPGSIEAYLDKAQPELRGSDAIGWNFTKFLVDAAGKVVKRFESSETPDAIEKDIVARLR